MLTVVSTTIRVSEATRDRLAALSRSTGRPMNEIVERALDALDRRVFFDDLNRQYDRLRGDRAAWSEIERERAVEEGSITDTSA